MPHNQVQDKQGEAIEEGDYVLTKYRGGTHEGEVCTMRFCSIHLAQGLVLLAAG